MIEISEIKELSKEILKEYKSPYSNCYKVCEQLRKNIDVPATVVKKEFGEKRETHYILAIHNKHLSDMEEDEGHTYIDPTIIQFNRSNYEKGKVKVNLGSRDFIKRSIGGEIGVFPPEAEEREVWYH